ncbi:MULTISPECIES: MFS transporter [Micrococcales]|uniref:MFS family permease n=3 Tax=Micrococcales TaxID=85006 RepID=A0AAW8NGB4_PSEOX|nr:MULTISPECIES: MFS transporter [Micrococcales]MDJ1370193.1 MFS transporter [Gulosibacter molinativorax]MDR7165619.1 MFS family permease [Pseudarthrobacter oxydans]QUY61606.1 MFS transporter [Gulosibacter molinativorax]
MSHPGTTAIETDAVRHMTDAEARKVTFGALLGTAMEWYDFFLFSAASALVFNIQYFAVGDATSAALASFATFGVGLAARPIGALIFGRMGDRVGRRKVLLITIVGIGIATGLIGVLPTYAAIGIAAPVLLVLLRVVQGLFMAGEWSGAITLVVENAPLERRAFYAAIPQLGSPIATILSSGGFFLLTLTLSQESFDSWGWRIPFLAAIPLLLVALYVRTKLSESPVFRELEERNEILTSPIKTAFKEQWRQILVATMTGTLGLAGFYLVTTFCVWYGVNMLGYSAGLMLLASLIAAAVEIPVLILAGRFGSKHGASRVVIWGSSAAILLSLPVFLMFSSGVPALVVTSMVVAVSVLALPFGASGAVITGLFSAKTRNSGTSLANNFAGMISGFIPVLTTSWVAAVGGHWWPAVAMLVLLAVLTGISGLLAPRMSVAIPGFKH